MQKTIKNDWLRESGEPFARAQILKYNVHPEGLDVDRLRFSESGLFRPNSNVGHIISILRGNGKLYLKGDNKQTLRLEAGVHLYLPPDLETDLEAEAETELLAVSSPSAAQTRGKKLLLRHEMFLAACAAGTQSLRWIFTPQYLSRRIFLHHDPILLSKSGYPVSWFHTTMFDVSGLPNNEDGQPVFKMSYNSRTEVNVCYDVQGSGQVRMALHPYRETKQHWGPWITLDGDSTYHMNEAAGGPEEERRFDEATQNWQTFRNKHEIYITGGYVSLFCMFDPAPAGIERHRPGEYSDYEPLAQVLGTKAYENYTLELAQYDEMVDQLSMARAMGTLDALHGTPVWKLYESGRKAQAAIETKLVESLIAASNQRKQILARWMQAVTD
jgi:hypothetical protein